MAAISAVLGGSVAWGDVGSLAEGTLVGWGYNANGQTVTPAGSFVAFSGGFAHSLAVRSDGTLSAWGNNNSGQTNAPAGTFTASHPSGASAARTFCSTATGVGMCSSTSISVAAPKRRPRADSSRASIRCTGRPVDRARPVSQETCHHPMKPK